MPTWPSQSKSKEDVEDVVAALLAAGDGVSVAYDDAAGTLTIDGRPVEDVEDIVGAMVGYGLQYDDAAGILSETRQGPNPYDVAQTFEEVDVSVDGYAFSLNGHLQMQDSATPYNVGMSAGSSLSGRRGVEFTANGPITEISASVAAGGLTTAYVLQSDGSTVASASISGGSVTLSGFTLSAGSTYYLVGDAGGSDYTEYTDGAPSFPYSTTIADVTRGAFNSTITSDSSLFNFEAVTFSGSTNNASPRVYWPNDRTDIYEWDTATFTVTEDGATVDPYVIYNDGSGWVRANGGNPISRHYGVGDDPAISPSDNVGLEFEMSRPDDTYNPTIDSAMVSWLL